MPRVPKDPKTRQRRNRDVTAATFIDTSPIAKGRVPKLPTRKNSSGEAIPWRPEAKGVWRDIWGSPMAGEYTQADVHRVVMYVDLIDRYWSSGLPDLAAEIRLQGVCLGVTPIDRRRLQWEIRRVEAPAPSKPAKPARPERQADPRAVIKSVK
jgi:hypothetical protein